MDRRPELAEVCAVIRSQVTASEWESFQHGFHHAKYDSGSVPTLWLLTMWEAESVTV